MKLKDLPTNTRVRQAGALGADVTRLLHEVAVNPYREAGLLVTLAAAQRLAAAPLLALIDQRRRFGYGREGGIAPREVRKAA